MIFIRRGEFVAYGALTLAMIGNGVFPATGCCSVPGSPSPPRRTRALRAGQARKLPSVLAVNIGYPLAVLALLRLLP